MEVRDPVCGMRFDAEQAAATAEYRGGTYYFCTEHCRTAFEEDPERYVECEGEV
ncbi:MAG: YHS domain-containing protein [Gemmatimonadales bacterium]|nr:YHS domain-containing protein [Gemmatimonadales bacterium]NIN12064.1 YHS domain-containing protein [Gemmatimonadales bacterium]NIR03299.1 YHS domain-containing protein [Gemmatimonadales bacterium]NIS66979.1 YHS domain-containing protein [Gemmatimonadales bacterium]